MSKRQSTKVARVCELCKDEFKVYQITIDRSGAKYCSKACYLSATESKTEIRCHKCGKAFLVHRHKAKMGKALYCSLECWYGTVEENFWKNVVKGGLPNDCWGWVGTKDIYGYGVTHARRKSIKAHRFSYEIHHGPIPEGMFVCHRCDNPPCTNPNHLFAGTAMDNHRDMDSKGRRITVRGEGKSNAILTDAAIKDILARLGRGESQNSIGIIHGISQAKVSKINTGKIWKHVERP